MDKPLIHYTTNALNVMRFDPNPPDANGVRLLSDEQAGAMRGAYDTQFVTPDVLPDGALVYGRYLSGGRIVGYFIFAPVNDGKGSS